MFAPLHSTVCKRSRRPSPWLTPSLLSTIKQKKQAKRQAEWCNDDAAVQLYKHLKNKLKHLVNEAKMSYVKRLIFQTRKNPHSAGQLWCGVNNIIGRYQLHKSVLDTALSLDTVNDFLEVLQLLMIISLLLPLSLWNWGIMIQVLAFLWSLHSVYILCCVP